jgi:hypothetical protein
MRFTKTGGTICGNTSAPAWNRSTGSQGGHTVYILSSYNPSTIPYTPVRGKYRDTTAGPSDSIDTNDGTGLFD